MYNGQAGKFWVDIKLNRATMKDKEIYERIADTYLGKNNNKKNNSQRKKKKWFISLTVINILILFTVFFLYKFVLSNPRGKEGDNKTSASIYILSQRYPLKLSYNLTPPYLGIKDFTFSLPLVDASKLSSLKLRVRGDDNFGFTAVLKVEVRNQRNEKDSYYLKGISGRWQDFSIPLAEFKNITDWSNIGELSFVFEDWNVSEKRGVLYIDNIRFSE